MQRKLPVENRIELIGTIQSEIEFSNEFMGEKFYKFTISVLRYSGVSDDLLVVISEKLITNKVIKNALVIIKGQIRSYNIYEEVEVANSNMVTKVKQGGSVELRVFAWDCEAIDTIPDIENNVVTLSGYITKPPFSAKRKYNREKTELILAVPIQGDSYTRDNYIPCICWNRNAVFAQKLSVGDLVSIRGRYQSRSYPIGKEKGEQQSRTTFEVSAKTIKLEQQAECQE